MSYYEVLEISKGSSDIEIKKAYKILVLKHHPDKGGDVEKFKQIQEAYETLSDPIKKAGYDKPPLPPFPNFQPNFFSMFNHMQNNLFNMNNLFNTSGKTTYGSVGADFVHTIVVNRSEIDNPEYNKNQEININLKKRCLKCIIECFICKGSGFVQKRFRNGPFLSMTQEFCNHCGRTGSINTCINCDCDEGKIEEKKSINIIIPESGNGIFVFPDLGYQPEQKNGKSGSLIVKVVLDEIN